MELVLLLIFLLHIVIQEQRLSCFEFLTSIFNRALFLDFLRFFIQVYSQNPSQLPKRLHLDNRAKEVPTVKDPLPELAVFL
jgi:hypothetical protein